MHRTGQDDAGIWVCLAALVAVVLRWRRSTARQRRQLKWLARVILISE